MTRKLSQVVAVLLVAWLALVLVVGAAGGFVSPQRTPPLPIALGVTMPILVFLVGVWLSRPLRAFVLSLDPRVLTAIQAWRFGGFAFLALYAHRVLPGSFALPAGIGDMAVGVTAPWILWALLRDPSFAASRIYLAWNLFGLLDLVDAVALGALGSALATGAPGEISTAPMALLPLVLIPAYFVPLLAMLHGVAFMQARQYAGSETPRIGFSPQAHLR